MQRKKTTQTSLVLYKVIYSDWFKIIIHPRDLDSFTVNQAYFSEVQYINFK